ncbi:hypothetical protein SLEP1_g54730 [Rubroshorea leprosula]|uniref:Uncharacterized protein n=1 Tax=Rubroshorea leprosula TaxID=152421 RepID=A0AAV5MFU9_9ROSI|nr:hypothetical protein SLEP1_g54730 [Rubroshorea leprosula]
MPLLLRPLLYAPCQPAPPCSPSLALVPLPPPELASHHQPCSAPTLLSVPRSPTRLSPLPAIIPPLLAAPSLHALPPARLHLPLPEPRSALITPPPPRTNRQSILHSLPRLYLNRATPLRPCLLSRASASCTLQPYRKNNNTRRNWHHW